MNALLSKMATLRMLVRWRAAAAIGLAFASGASLLAQSSNSPSLEDSVSTSPTGHVAAPLLTATNEKVEAAWHFFTASNTLAASHGSKANQTEDFQARLEIARYHRRARQFDEATAGYVGILKGGAPEALQRTAMVELAETAGEQNDLARAQQIYAQYLTRWPKDASVPEILLRQALVYRRMGLNNLAVSKFYAVMTSALVLKPDRIDYYQKLVLRAQNEIAETQFELSDWKDAAESFGRLLKLDSPPANRSTLQSRYIRCLTGLGRYDEAMAQAQNFLEQYTNAPERAEVRFLYASALNKSGRSAEALQQVLGLLQEEHSLAANYPETLAYWQRRAGNEIANQFYQEGDWMKALDIYLALAKLDSSPEWQLPAWYQAGLVFERLNQPTKAIEYYNDIIQQEKAVPTNAPPSLQTVLEMAKWRKNTVTWQMKARAENLALDSVLKEPGTNKVSAAVPASSSL